MEESQALVRFEPGWVENGTSEDGMPRYRETVMIIKAVPPYTTLPPYEATAQDIEENPGPYKLFVKEQGARTLEPRPEGYPLALWPVIGPAHFRMLAHRGITTIEQLAALGGNMPGEFRELVDRAKQMLELSANIGKFEAMVLERDRQIEALVEQVAEMRGTISAQNSLINTLKSAEARMQVA